MDSTTSAIPSVRASRPFAASRVARDYEDALAYATHTHPTSILTNGVTSVIRLLCMGICLMLVVAAPVKPIAQEDWGRPGDYGYRHQEYHHRGIIEELRRKTGQLCCDGIGECRATYANMQA